MLSDFLCFIQFLLIVFKCAFQFFFFSFFNSGTSDGMSQFEQFVLKKLEVKNCYSECIYVYWCVYVYTCDETVFYCLKSSTQTMRHTCS